MSPEPEVEYSRIRDVVIPVFNYDRFHRPSSNEREFQDKRLLERSRLINVFIELLTTPIFSGTYLVAGFRGVGKTSILKQAVLKFIYRKSEKRNRFARWGRTVKNKYVVIDINLSHKELSSFDVLKTMAWSLHDRYSAGRLHKLTKLAKAAILTTLIIVYIYWLVLKLDALGVFSCWKNILSLFQFPDYGYLLVPVVAVFVGALYRVIGWDISHKKNIDRLRLLLDRINSSLRTTDGIQAGGLRTIGMFRKSQEKKYRDLNDKEIAYELSEIINRASSGPCFRPRSRFIFIVDELDKIESITSVDGGNIFPNDHLRRKREKIFDLVGEMKHFFTMARAKFFFVTGSEMYDAALADVTERDSYLGSIFHHVVYVPSFLTDFNNQSSTITEQTENLLCKFLIPPDVLKQTNETLQTPLNPDKLLLTDYFHLQFENKKDDHEIIKLHYILSSYVKFLTLRSKGSPKKIMALIEENLVRRSHISQGLELKEYYLGTLKWPTECKTDKFLIFDEVDQFKIGLTGYLYSPFLYSYSSFIANHSDKLILSSAFIWDHLHKYHNAAFSVHHLEYIYELTASSKEPEIKNQLTFLLSLMKSRHLREIRSGIFEFKFFSRISNEIKFLSNIVQSESAVFNFTLDESMSLKRYYAAQLEEINKGFENDSRNPYIRGFLSRIIGDLHFFDKEYDRAIVHYENALKYFYNIDPNNFSNGELANMVRWLLLLSLANEKSGHFTKSFAICKDIQREFRRLFKNFKNRNGYREILLYSKIPYAHIIQKLSIIEKTGLNGLNKDDVETAYEEIAEIYGGSYNPTTNELKLNTNHNLLIRSEINFKIINILFYRNTNQEHQILVGRKPFGDTIPYMAGLYIQCIVEVLSPAFSSRIYKTIESVKDVLDIKKLEEFCKPEGPNYYAALSDYFSKAGNAYITDHTPPSESETESESISEFLKNLHVINPIAGSEVPDALLQNKYFMAVRLIYTASILSKKINDSANESAQLLKILYIIRNIVDRPEKKSDSPDVNIDKEKIGKECSKILTEILKIVHRKNENFKRLFMQKYKEGLFHDKKSEFLSKLQENVIQLIKSFPDAPDGIEALILYYEILTKCDSSHFEKENIKHFIATINEHDIVQSQYIRVMELYFKTRYYYHKINKCIDPNIDPKDLAKVQSYSTIALDAIYCLVEILRLLNIQRNSFIIGYSYTGNFYHRLGWWIVYKRRLDRIIDDGIEKKLNGFAPLKNKLADQMKKLLYDSSIPMLAKYNIEMAKLHFAKAKETHNRGQAYRDALANMYTMDDDFNDDFSHFLVALERMSINSGCLDEEIKSCDKLLASIKEKENDKRDKKTEIKESDWIFNVETF